MPKLNLDKQYLWRRQTYGPGVTEVPDGLALALEPRGILPVPDAASADPDPLADFPQLSEAGYTSADAVRAADDDTLLAVPGIGKATLTKIRAATQE